MNGIERAQLRSTWRRSHRKTRAKGAAKILPALRLWSFIEPLGTDAILAAHRLGAIVLADVLVMVSAVPQADSHAIHKQASATRIRSPSFHSLG